MILVHQPTIGDHAKRLAPVGLLDLGQLRRDQPERLVPRRWNQMLSATNQWSIDALATVDKVDRVPPHRAEKIVVDAAGCPTSAIARHRPDQLLAARPGEHRTAVRAEVADRWGLLQVPWARNILVGDVEQRSCRTDIDAVAAVGALDPAPEGADHRRRPAVDRRDGELVHPLLADSRAPLAGHTPLWIVVDERRDLPLEEDLLVVVLRARAILAKSVGLVLQLTFPCPITDRAVDWVVGEQKLDHRGTHLLDLFGVGRHHHPFADRHGARRLQLRYPGVVDPHDAHPTRGLRRQSAKVAESWEIDPIHLARLDQQLTFRRDNFLPIDG